MKKNVLIVIFVCFLLCGCSRGQTNTEELSGQAVDYFFPEGISSQEYQAVFSGFSGEPEKMIVTLSVKEVRRFQEGILYELTADSEERGFEKYEQYMENWLDGGLFFVYDGDVYFIPGMSTQENYQSAEEIQQTGTLVCSDTGKEDSLGEDEKGRHEYIAVGGGRREYHAYNDLVETGQYECFVWEAERGLVGCWRGYGSRSQDIELYLPGEESIR